MATDKRDLEIRIEDSLLEGEYLVNVFFDQSRANLYYHPTNFRIVKLESDQQIVLFDSEGGKDEDQDPEAQ